MGPAPRADGKQLKWRSQVQPDGTPIKYSWKWPQERGGCPEVRYDLEPIGAHAGTESDPYCQLASKELLARLATAIPDAGVDNTWSNHFMSTLFEHDNTKLAAAAARSRPSSTVSVATELRPSGVSFKTYFQPRLPGYGGLTPTHVYEDSIADMELETTARTAVLDFLSTSPEGHLLRPIGLGVDNRADSCLKWRFSYPHTSFASVCSIVTLDGRIQHRHIERQLAALRELTISLLGLPVDFPDTEHSAPFLRARAPLPSPPGYSYSFHIAPGQDLPSVELSLPVRNYNRDDLNVARAFTAWMERQGRGSYCRRYMALVERLAATRGVRLAESRGLQEFVSVQLKANGEMDVTTHFSARAFAEMEQEKEREKWRASPRRGTLQRGEAY